MKLQVFVSLLLLAQMAFAFDFTQERDTLLVPIDTTNRLDFVFTSASDDNIVISAVGERPWMVVTPSSFFIKAGKNETVSLFATPNSGINTGLYGVRMTAESLVTKEKKYKDVFISVEKESGVYIDKVLVVGDMIPTGKVSVSANLRNFGTSTVQSVGMDVAVASKSKKVAEFSDTIEKIDPEKTVAVEKEFYLPRLAEAGEYTVTIRISYADKARSFTDTFTVVEKPVIKKEISDYSPFATGYARTISIRNDGNVAGNADVTETVSSFASLFLSGNRPDYLANDKIAWSFNSIKPGETIIIYYKIDYLMAVVLLFAVLLISWFILVKLRTVRIGKRIMQKKMIEEGAEFTVGVDIKNAIGSSVSGVAVRDFVPSVFEVKDAEGLKPAKKKAAHGTELTWKLDDLFDKEERVLSYKIAPVFGVHGQIPLPQASVKFKFSSRETENKSNSTAVGIVEKEKVPTLDQLFKSRRKKK